MRVMWVLLAVWATLAAIPSSTAAELCISQGNRFPRFASEGLAPPGKFPRGPDDIKLCRIFSGRTCCTALHTHHALVALRNLAVNGEGGGECLAMWEVVECSVCDPRVGTSPGPPVLCRDLCNAVFAACSSAYFSMDASKQAVMPCASSDVICAKGAEWTRNSSHFCELAGFRVVERSSGQFCYDGSAAGDFDPSPAASSPSRKDKKQARASRMNSLRKKFDRTSLMTDRVLWAVAGLVLTAGAVFLRQRGTRSRQRRAALMKKLKDVRTSQQAAFNKRG